MTRSKVGSLGTRPSWGDPGRASDHIVHFESRPDLHGRRVILFCRVSGRTQKKRKNLADQEAFLWRYAEASCPIADEVFFVGSGWVNSHEFYTEAYPVHFTRVVAAAKELDAFLLAESTCRFIRPYGYHSRRNPDATATRFDLERLMEMAAGVTLATVLPPDAPPEAVRRAQTKRGQEAKGNVGGCPKKTSAGETTRRREEKKPRVLELANQMSPRKIGKCLGVPHTTVCRWLSEGM